MVPPPPAPRPRRADSGEIDALRTEREAARRLYEVLRAGGRVAMFLDYDGTLREIEAEPAAATPSPPVRALLDALGADPRIDVTVVSGRTPADLDSFFGDYQFCLVAEHGAAVRRAESRTWDKLDEKVSYAWRDELLGLFRTHAEGTPGSFVEEKRTSLVWHYRRADPGDGERKARELVAKLSPVAAALSLDVRVGKKIVEVTAAGVNKGSAATHLLDGANASYNLVIVAGDDVTDESMFALRVPNLLSIKVGEGATRAAYRVSSPNALRQVLTPRDADATAAEQP